MKNQVKFTKNNAQHVSKSDRKMQDKKAMYKKVRQQKRNYEL